MRTDGICPDPAACVADPDRCCGWATEADCHAGQHGASGKCDHHPTPAQEAANIAAIATEHGADAAHDAALAIGDKYGHESEVGKAAWGAANAAAEAERLAADPTPGCKGTHQAWGISWCGSCADRGVWHAPRNAK